MCTVKSVSPCQEISSHFLCQVCTGWSHDESAEEQGGRVVSPRAVAINDRVRKTWRMVLSTSIHLDLHGLVIWKVQHSNVISAKGRTSDPMTPSPPELCDNSTERTAHRFSLPGSNSQRCRTFLGACRVLTIRAPTLMAAISSGKTPQRPTSILLVCVMRNVATTEGNLERDRCD